MNAIWKLNLWHPYGANLWYITVYVDIIVMIGCCFYVDRRDKLQRAISIKLISVCVKNGQTRDIGVVSSLKDGFGFIRCAEQELSIFFHFSEVLEQVCNKYILETL